MSNSFLIQILLFNELQMLQPKDVALVKHDDNDPDYNVRVSRTQEIMRNQLYYLVVLNDLQSLEEKNLLSVIQI